MPTREGFLGLEADCRIVIPETADTSLYLHAVCLHNASHKTQQAKQDIYMLCMVAQDWAMEFQSAAPGGALNESSFAGALQNVYPEIARSKACYLSPAMASCEVLKLWRGFETQSEQGGLMQLPTFWAICEAVDVLSLRDLEGPAAHVQAIAQGDEAASEFADMSLEDWRCSTDARTCFQLV